LADVDAARLLCHVRFDDPISSTVLSETIERGATSVTSTPGLANSSRCLSSSHSFPLLPGRPLILTSAHSPNIFFPYIRKASFPDVIPLTGSSGSVSSQVPLSQMMTFPPP